MFKSGDFKEIPFEAAIDKWPLLMGAFFEKCLTLNRPPKSDQDIEITVEAKNMPTGAPMEIICKFF